MDLIQLCLVPGAITLVVILAGLLALRVAGVKVKIVPEGKQIVVYRLGRFQRIAGPGVAVLNRFETVAQTINTRSEQVSHRTSTNYFMHGVPFNWTLTFWSHTDLVRAANGQRQRLVELAQYSDGERREHLRGKLHEAMYKYVPRIAREHNLSEKPTVVEQLLPVLPGMPECERLLELVAGELERTLPTVGIYLDTQHPVTISAVHVGQEVLDSFSRGRVWRMLREQMPDVPNELLLQAFSAIEGFDIHTARLYLENKGASVREVRMEEGHISGVKVRPEPSIEAEEEQPYEEDQPTAIPSSFGHDGPLTREDLSVLKRLPRDNARRAAG